MGIEVSRPDSCTKKRRAKREILKETHRSKYTIHPDSNKMYQDLKKLYYWDNMKKEIAQIVQTCINC